MQMADATLYERAQELSLATKLEQRTLLSIGQKGEVRELILFEAEHLEGAISVLFAELPRIVERMQRNGVNCRLITYGNEECRGQYERKKVS
jgi:hypothetical protein